MQRYANEGKKISEIYDLFALRIIVKSVQDCYLSLGVIHQAWRPIPGAFDDYIANSKDSLYQSIHTTVIGPDNKPLEVQIRTTDMHERAEIGVAAHWKYKEQNIDNIDPRFEKRLVWLRSILERQIESTDTDEFIESLKHDLFQDQVFVYTPNSDLKMLPSGSTPVDFAFSVHTDLGFYCDEAKVNGSLVSLKYPLQNGDIVEIITSKKVSPSLHWLPVTKTGKARAAIRRYWQARGNSNTPKTKEYNCTLWISLPDKPGKLGEVTTLVGGYNLNISSVEMTERRKEYINFKFNLIIKDLKNFTNLISELKQRDFKFKIIRHENKKINAFTQKIFKYFKKN